MSQRTGRSTAERAGFERAWQAADARLASGEVPGYVAAIRMDGEIQVRAAGRTTTEPDGPPMTPDTLFRIASVGKPIGGALTLSLVQDGLLALDDPIARWLPEAASPRVLISAGGPLDQVTQGRPVTVRHLLTMTSGWGAVLEPCPLQAAMIERGVYPGPLIPQFSGDEFVARVTSLPLAFQPGEGWLYDTGMELLGVLLARATGRPLAELVDERITGPLGMAATGFWADGPGRLAAAYQPDDDRLELLDPPDGMFSRPPAFAALGAGLVSTAPDLLRFFCAMADGGAPVLTPESVALMTADALTGAQREQALPIVGPGTSWGLGTGVEIEAARPWMAPGRWGWDGGTGTSAHVDPARGIVGIYLSQRGMTGPQDGFSDFWTAMAGA